MEALAIEKPKFKFGDCSVPCGKRGPWTIDEVTVTAEDALMHNLRAMRDGNAYLTIKAGTFKRLWHEKRGVVMSNTRMEVITAYEAYRDAKGNVLVFGLGLGMVLEGILSKPEVNRVTVVEIDPDVIALVAPHFGNDGRVTIVQGDAYAWEPPKGEVYDYVWHDIWDDINADNLPLMAKLSRRFSRKAKAQGFWSREQARRDKRRWG